MVLLDTTILIDIIKNNSKAIEKYKEIINNNRDIWIAAPSITEIIIGLYSIHAKKDEETKIIDTINKCHALNITKEVAIKAGYIERSLMEDGNQIGIIDSLISATAIVNNKTIITKNIKHFKKVPGLKVEGY